MPQFKTINSSLLTILYGATVTSIHDNWKNHSFDYTELFQQSNAGCWARPLPAQSLQKGVHRVPVLLLECSCRPQELFVYPPEGMARAVKTKSTSRNKVRVPRFSQRRAWQNPSVLSRAKHGEPQQLRGLSPTSQRPWLTVSAHMLS